MARQAVDTTTNNGTYIGDPAPVAFNKINAMTQEIYGWGGGGALAKLAGGNNFTGTQTSGAFTADGSSASLNFLDRIDVSRTWSLYSTGAVARLWLTGFGDRLTVNSQGQVTAASFNPTSSADVKDYIEGYTGDADSEINRLVVISYRYRPEFADTGDKRYVGLLAENVSDVHPGATGGDVQSVTQNDSGEEVIAHVPMNIDMMQILALNTRAHQQKSRRIEHLEQTIEQLLNRLAALEASAA
ncbi:hypothetical protein KV692_05565 [Xanthomonas euvesicatoria pv. physalidis]|uniref:hypothetical protein n=1 Tax=Xanthomonas euvesicatoria TaxID=456327 RepID=UPI001C47343A|nr:hypothetical protein [Xanthomonas euvesicatoria]MBV6687361.1 hypothetical protein [Xanthomonas euvesicatoria pv. physalidis]